MGDDAKKNFVVPNWAGKPSVGLHLDVMKEGKLIQKLMIDEKKCYFFGRNKELCDFQIDHGSCSRVHAVLLWHKHLDRPFLIDLGSTHGTFIGHVRLEINKPQQVFIDSELRFGASTRSYIIREKPKANKHVSSLIQNTNEDGISKHHDNNNDKQNLPESEAELDNLTEFNTAHNRRIAQIVNLTESNLNSMLPPTVRKKKKHVNFNEEEQVINPEDIDPSVGRFRNLVQTTFVIPTKKRPSNEPMSRYLMDSSKLNLIDKESGGGGAGAGAGISSHNSLYDDDDDYKIKKFKSSEYDQQRSHSFDIASKLGIKLPDLAPDIVAQQQQSSASSLAEKEFMYARKLESEFIDEDDDHFTGASSGGSGLYDKKKKYAKEAWPGRKPNAPNNSSYSLF